MTIDLNKTYIAKKAILGMCPVGTRLTPWATNKVLKVGAVDPDMIGFNMVTGGGCFLKEEDVEEA